MEGEKTNLKSVLEKDELISPDLRATSLLRYCYDERLATFRIDEPSHWLETVFPKDLASLGFRYLGRGKIKCVSCLFHFEVYMRPYGSRKSFRAYLFRIHQSNSPWCPFSRAEESYNIDQSLGMITIKNSRMQSKVERYKTFFQFEKKNGLQCPMSYIDELVDNGFFIGSDHCYDVYCAFCGIWINWCFQLGDNPKKLHKEKNSRCIVFSKKFSYFDL